MPDAIYSTVQEIDRLSAKGAITYRGGLAVRAVEEDRDGVDIAWCDRSGSTGKHRYDAVFLAAGALNTTRLLMRTLKLYDQRALLLDSQKTIIPLVKMRSTANALSERKPILPGLFLDLCDPAVDEHWIHLQIYAVNAPVLERLGIDLDQPRQLRRALLAPVLSRLMVGFLSLHSDHSGRLEVRLDAQSQRLDVRAVRRSETARHVRRAARRLFHLGLRFGVIFVTPGIQIAAPGEGHHIGGSFPMRSQPGGSHGNGCVGSPQQSP